MSEISHQDTGASPQVGAYPLLRKGAEASLRKGWCPGALRPMLARDGFIVRLRITGGIVPARTAGALADLAAQFGNGLLDLSARGNLQIRGVGEDTLPSLQDRLQSLDILDTHAEAESVRNLIVSPLAGLHEGLDVRPLAAALETRLVADTTLHALPSKFGFLLDDGSAPSLVSVAADLRFDWSAAEGVFFIGLGGSRHDALSVGACSADDFVEAAARVARRALGLFATHPTARRMRDLIGICGSAEVARCCGRDIGASLPETSTAASAADLVGIRTFDGVRTFGLAAPFGRLDHAMLRRASDRAEASGTSEIRLTPWRTLLLPLRVGAAKMDSAVPGFITDPRDPRLAIAACVGMQGCARGTTPTHADAERIAASLGASGGPLHVSGCEKGCAKPSASPITLVGRGGRYDLVRAGWPGDRPALRGLSLDAAIAAIKDAA